MYVCKACNACSVVECIVCMYVCMYACKVGMYVMIVCNICMYVCNVCVMSWRSALMSAILATAVVGDDWQTRFIACAAGCQQHVCLGPAGAPALLGCAPLCVLAGVRLRALPLSCGSSTSSGRLRGEVPRAGRAASVQSNEQQNRNRKKSNVCMHVM